MLHSYYANMRIYRERIHVHQGSPKRFTVACDPPCLNQETPKTSGRFRVQVLYERPESPANKAIPAIAVSATYGKYEKGGNLASIPVSASKSL